MPNLIDKEHCCGCFACANICKVGAIQMIADNTGFVFPVVDLSKCIECGACERVCPALNPMICDNKTFSPRVYIVQHKDNKIRYQSTSGGAFTAIAEKIIMRGGVVFGASMNNKLEVLHSESETIEDLSKFRNSKYVQSSIGNTYKKAKKYLDSERLVCFSGTPCQINGLHKYLGKDYKNLISVDIVCRSVPSPLIFDKYVEFLKKKIPEIQNVVFRDKKRGYSYCTMAWYIDDEAKAASKSLYRRSSEADQWLRLFLGRYCDRLSCYSCQYQKVPRIADFTLGDYWDVSNIAPDLNDNKGTTNVVIWTKKGQEFMNSLKDLISYREYPFKLSAISRGEVRNNIPRLNREEFFKDANELESEDFINKWVPFTLKIKIKYIGRYLIYKLHIHNIVRNFSHFVSHR